MYSDMSMRTIARSSSKRKSASVRASSVLPTPVGPRNRNEPIGRCGSDEPGTRTPDRVRHRVHRFVLADDALVQHLFEAHELRDLALHQPAHGDAGPLGDDLGDVFLVDFFLQHRAVVLELDEPVGHRRDLAFEDGQVPVTQLRGALEVAVALGPIGLAARGLRAVPCRRGSRLIASFSLCQCATIPSRSSPSDASSASSRSSRACDASSVSFASAARSISSWRMRRSTTSISKGIESISMRSRDAASSMRSIALSGRRRAGM